LEKAPRILERINMRGKNKVKKSKIKEPWEIGGSQNKEPCPGKGGLIRGRSSQGKEKMDTIAKDALGSENLSTKCGMGEDGNRVKGRDIKRVTKYIAQFVGGSFKRINRKMEGFQNGGTL